MEEAGIENPSNPHHYRHSRASYLAKHLTEAQSCEWFGWVQGSDVPANYVHLSGRDIDNAYDGMHGLYEPEDDEEEPQVQECPRYDEMNEPGASFCMRCGYALDQKTAGELEAEVGEATKESYAQTDPEHEEQMANLDTFDEVMDDPEVKAAMLDELEDELRQRLAGD